MTERVLDISTAPARLHVRHAQLVIEPEEGAEVTTPLAELAVLVISHPRVLMTQSVISGVAENGGAVVICDGKHLPVAQMLPLQTHSTQSERFARQALASLPLRKRLWQQIVRAKIRAQGRLLRELHGTDGGLSAMAERVRSGDGSNLESQASRRYWPLLFGDPKFRRGSEGPDQNAHLNYGYAVLRAMVARALCGAGLHPSFGLQHHNRYDAFRLADDVMEPFRPLVDRAVYRWVQEHDPQEPLDKAAKAWLVRPMLERYNCEGELRTLFDVLSRVAASLARCFLESQRELYLPEM
ncbi:MAG TPA: type II CRISPR-associated endonuclease Cas1 [Bryobacteraceae bacterium]|nr:type II CRISPR-associated endonuclease Cas1 [Bryobacteraceae bacterium]